MTTSCPREQALREFDRLFGEARSQALEHVRICARCRARFVAEDPSRVFALLALQPVPLAVLQSVSRETARSLGPSAPDAARGSRAARAAAWAATLLIAAATGGLLLLPDAPEPREVAGIASDSGRASGVELLSSPGSARVVDVTVGDTQLVMIFDKEIPL